MALKICIILLALLALLLTVPIGADIGYDEGGLRVYARVSRFTLCVYPSTKEKKPQKPKKPKAKTKQSGKLDIASDEIYDALSVLVRSVKKLRFHLRKLKLDFVSAFDDPYQTAIVYGYAEALVWGLGLPQLKQSDIHLDMDFASEQCRVDGCLSVTIRIYYIIKLCLCAVFGLLPILRRRSKRIKATEINTPAKGMTA